MVADRVLILPGTRKSAINERKRPYRGSLPDRLPLPSKYVARSAINGGAHNLVRASDVVVVGAFFRRDSHVEISIGIP